MRCNRIRTHGLFEAYQISRLDADDAVAWRVDIRDEHEGDRGNERQDASNLPSTLLPWKPQPTSRLQQIPIAAIKAHAAVAIRLRSAPSVSPCELKTSFIPETARPTTGVGLVVAAAWTVDHRSACSRPVCALISRRLDSSLVPE